VAARREILVRAERQPWNRDGVLALYRLSDWCRWNARKIRALRSFAASLGRDGEELDAAQDALARAARLEVLGLAVELELDELVRSIR
jgi:hypothetical protein